MTGQYIGLKKKKKKKEAQMKRLVQGNLGNVRLLLRLFQNRTKNTLKVKPALTSKPFAKVIYVTYVNIAVL